MRTLLIDNYDSYTYNLYHLLSQSAPNQPPPVIIRNDAYPTFTHLLKSSPLNNIPISSIVISPGPGHPRNLNDFPQLCRDAISQTDIPVLGVCLGHQGIITEFGGVVEKDEPAHGRISEILVRGDDIGLWKGMPKAFKVVRYHSLVATKVSDKMEVVGRLKEGGQIMGVKVKDRCCWGVQFHPESVGTQWGGTILRNFREMAFAWRPVIDKGVSGGFLECGITKEEFEQRGTNIGRKKLRKGRLLRVTWRKVDDVTSSSLEIFRALFCESPHAWWLDSSLRGSSMGRFSFMGDATGPLSEVITYKTRLSTGTLVDRNGSHSLTPEGGLLPWLKKRLKSRFVTMSDIKPGLPFEFNCGYVACMGYEMKCETDDRRENLRDSDFPDAALLFADRLVAIDHAYEGCVYLVAAGRTSGEDDVPNEQWFERMKSKVRTAREWRSPSPRGVKNTCGALLKETPRKWRRKWGEYNERLVFNMERTRREYEDDINRCLEKIRNGDTYEVCLTNRIQARIPQAASSFQIYEHLREINPAPYAAFLKMGNRCDVCCSSPERFLKVDANGLVESKPIKGTRGRGSTISEDKKLKDELAHSVKDRSENLMIVDLVRNDLGRVCEVGSVRVSRFMHVETYAAVHQLVSTIRGQLRSGCSILDCFRETYPMGSMTGAPKTRTMEIIDRVEHSARGLYSGTIGYFALCGATDLNVTIRSAVIHDGRVTIGAGGAIVALSDPHEEFSETVLKGAAVMRAVSRAITGRDDYVLDVECSTRRNKAFVTASHYCEKRVKRKTSDEVTVVE